jgi:hypothetical protein
MPKLLLLAILAAGCNPTGYYVANVFVDANGMYTQRCAIDGGTHSDKPDPEHCRFERVGPPPAEALAQVGGAPAAPAPPATPPTPAAPPPPAP